MNPMGKLINDICEDILKSFGTCMLLASYWEVLE